MTNQEHASSIQSGTIVFAAGNKYKVVRVEFDEKHGFIVVGHRMVKSSGKFSGQSNQHAVGHIPPEIVE